MRNFLLSNSQYGQTTSMEILMKGDNPTLGIQLLNNECTYTLPSLQDYVHTPLATPDNIAACVLQ